MSVSLLGGVAVPIKGLERAVLCELEPLSAEQHRPAQVPLVVMGHVYHYYVLCEEGGVRRDGRGAAIVATEGCKGW